MTSVRCMTIPMSVIWPRRRIKNRIELNNEIYIHIGKSPACGRISTGLW
jgi:hypothetical protein